MQKQQKSTKKIDAVIEKFGKTAQEQMDSWLELENE
jgi:hypothetical protein